MIKNNKFNLLIHFSVIICTLYILYFRFIRYLLADNESIAIAMLNPQQLPQSNPVLFSLLMLGLILVLFSLMRLKAASGFIFRFVKGLYGYCLLLLTMMLATYSAKTLLPESWQKPVIESRHLFVEVTANDTRLRAEPSLKAPIITTLDSGTLLLLNDIKEAEGYTWNRVLLAPKQYAWLVRVAQLDDETRKRLSKTYKFYFTRADQTSLLLALLGFFWGVLSYKRH